MVRRILEAPALTAVLLLADGGALARADEVPSTPKESLEPPTESPGGEPREPEPPPEAQAFQAPPPMDPRTDGGFPLQADLAVRMRILELDLRALAPLDGRHLITSIMSMVTGGIAVGIGVALHAKYEEHHVHELLYVIGGGSLASGIVRLALTPDYDGPYLDFAHMPMRTEGEAAARVRSGENALEQMATDASLARILDGSISILTGGLMIPAYFGPRDYQVDIYGAFIIAAASITGVSGLLNLIFRSEAEARWSAYQRMRDRLPSHADAAGLPVDVSAVGLPGGALFQLRARF